MRPQNVIDRARTKNEAFGRLRAWLCVRLLVTFVWLLCDIIVAGWLYDHIEAIDVARAMLDEAEAALNAIDRAERAYRLAEGAEGDTQPPDARPGLHLVDDDATPTEDVT